MILVFFSVPLQLGASGASISPVNTRAASAATEAVNAIEWIVEVDS